MSRRTVIERFSIGDLVLGNYTLEPNTPILIERANRGDGRGVYYSDGAPGQAEKDIDKAPVYYAAGIGGFSGQCVIVVFSEKTEEELKAELAAMTPMQRLFYEINLSPAKQQIDCLEVESLNDLLKGYPDYVSSIAGLNNHTVAALMCLHSGVRAIMTQGERAQFDAVIATVRAQLIDMDKISTASGKIWAAIHEE